MYVGFLLLCRVVANLLSKEPLCNCRPYFIKIIIDNPNEIKIYLQVKKLILLSMLGDFFILAVCFI